MLRQKSWLVTLRVLLVDRVTAVVVPDDWSASLIEFAKLNSTSDTRDRDDRSTRTDLRFKVRMAVG